MPRGHPARLTIGRRHTVHLRSRRSIRYDEMVSAGLARSPSLLLSTLLVLSGCQILLPFQPGELPARLDGGDGSSVRLDSRHELSRTDSDGWRLVYELDPTSGCPEGLALLSGGCAIANPFCRDVGNQHSLRVDPGGPYQQIQGLLRGVQRNSTDAFRYVGPRNGIPPTIDDPYLDGVSVTVGDPRRHVWSLASGLSRLGGAASCPCWGGQQPPAFVGDAWTCDSGNPIVQYLKQWYPELPLWDGDGVDASCQPPAPAGFVASLPAQTTEAIEVRLLLDGCDENVALTTLTLWVR